MRREGEKEHFLFLQKREIQSMADGDIKEDGRKERLRYVPYQVANRKPKRAHISISKALVLSTTLHSPRAYGKSVRKPSKETFLHIYLNFPAT